MSDYIYTSEGLVSTDALLHGKYKYIKRVKGKNGKWKYYYDVKELKRAGRNLGEKITGSKARKAYHKATANMLNKYEQFGYTGAKRRDAEKNSSAVRAQARRDLDKAVDEYKKGNNIFNKKKKLKQYESDLKEINSNLKAARTKEEKVKKADDAAKKEMDKAAKDLDKAYDKYKKTLAGKIALGITDLKETIKLKRTGKSTNVEKAKQAMAEGALRAHGKTPAAVYYDEGWKFAGFTNPFKKKKKKKKKSTGSITVNIDGKPHEFVRYD